MAEDLLISCPIWNKPCLQEKCISFEIHTKQRFKNVQSGKYIPINQLSYLNAIPEEQRKNMVQREVSVVKECRQLGKIISITTSEDNLIPNFS